MKAQHEILFKGKTLDTGKWICGVPVFSVNDQCYMVYGATEDAINTLNKVDFYLCEVDPTTVVQFAGLKDKNGVYVYDGDIVEYIDDIGEVCNGVVEFKLGSYVIMPCGNTQITFNPSSTSICDFWFSIIGNIHDNPELI